MAQGRKGIVIAGLAAVAVAAGIAAWKGLHPEELAAPLAASEQVDVAFRPALAPAVPASAESAAPLAAVGREAPMTVSSAASEADAPCTFDLEESRRAGRIVADMKAVEARLHQRFESMAAGDDLQQRALGLALLHRGEWRERMLRLGEALARCRTDEACRTRAMDADHAKAVPNSHAEALAQLALQSGDVAVQALALRQCESAAGVACAAMSAIDWAQREPDNAAAWIAVASANQLSVDPTAVDNALYRASVAMRHDDHGRKALATLHAARPPDVDALTELIWYSQARVGDGHIALRAVLGWHCGPEALADSNRAQLCDKLVNTLLRLVDSTDDLKVAVELAERLGWPQDRLVPWKDEADAGEYLFDRRMRSGPVGCASVQRLRGHYRQLSEVGSRAAARAELVRQGQSLAQVAARAREAHRDRAAMVAAYAASAAVARAAGVPPEFPMSSEVRSEATPRP